MMAAFFAREYHYLVRYVRSLIADTAARDGEDIVQDVALHLFEKLDVAAPIENLAGYIYRALRNRVIDEIRKRKIDTVSLENPIAADSRMRLADVLQDAGFDLHKSMGRAYFLLAFNGRIC